MLVQWEVQFHEVVQAQEQVVAVFQLLVLGCRLVQCFLPVSLFLDFLLLLPLVVDSADHSLDPAGVMLRPVGVMCSPFEQQKVGSTGATGARGGGWGMGQRVAASIGLPPAPFVPMGGET